MIKDEDTKSYSHWENNQYHKTHGLTNTRIYDIWCNMKGRCYNDNIPSFSNYGGRGITICSEWKENFLSFYSWSMENGYSDELSIDRIDVDRNYEPNNCRWVTRKVQNNNQRSNHIIEYNGEKKNLIEWSEILNISYDTLRYRLKRNWTIKRAFTTPVGNGEKINGRYIEFNGEIKTITQWSKIVGISAETLNKRLDKYKWTVEKAFTTQVKGGGHNE